MTGLLATKPRPVDVPALAEAALWQELELTPAGAGGQAQ